MSPKILIIGDRAMHPMLAVNAVMHALSELATNLPGLTERDFITGDLETGVERAVRYLLPKVNTFVYPLGADGKPDFEQAYEDLADDVRLVVILHTDPLSSHVARAAMAQFPQHSILLPMSESSTLDA